MPYPDPRFDRAAQAAATAYYQALGQPLTWDQLSAAAKLWWRRTAFTAPGAAFRDLSQPAASTEPARAST